MSEAVYSVVARQGGKEIGRITLSDVNQFFGSGAAAHLKLPGEEIAAQVGWLRIGRDGRVLVSVMIETTVVTLDGSTLPPFKPTEWREGSRLGVGGCTLELIAGERSSAQTLPPTVQQEFLTLDPAARTIPPAEPPSVPTPRSVPRPTEESPMTRDLFGQDDTEDQAALHTTEDYVQPSPPPRSVSRPTEESPMAGAPFPPLEQPPSRVPEFTTFTQAVDPGEDTPAHVFGGDRVTEPYVPRGERPTEAYTLPPEGLDMGMTRRKDWRDEGRLSAQLGLSSVNFVPGERISLPVSLRNEYTHELELLVALAGLPGDWLIDDLPLITLAPGETRALDLVIQTRAFSGPERLEGMLRFYDRATPQITITLPLRMFLKRAPDLTGVFEPTLVREGEALFLRLQNHTLSPMTVTLSVSEQPAGLRVLLPMPRVDLAPNQRTAVPVQVDVRARSLFARRAYRFGIAGQQGTRAPLDFPGEVLANALIPPLVALLLIGVLALLCGVLALLAVPNLRSMISPPTATPIPTATFTPTLMPSPTLTPFPTDVPPPSATPTPAFTDPRSLDCQSRVAAPPGWTRTHIIVSGDRLFQLAGRYGTSVAELMRVNCLNDDRIFPNQRLLVPGAL
ncbi:MAG: LysM peptidoglycan-binding domain-containing protein [Anaerolineae bacterium]|nr:LysM peptidoglycan-binding domain-containing protein [Anaerolineae bacterium]